jgi:hypothetical protein
LKLLFKELEMSDAKFMVITVADPEKLSATEASDQLGQAISDLKANSNVLTARWGRFGTGENVGKIIAFQSYASMAEIESGYEAFSGSSAYANFLDKATVLKRGILRLHDIDTPAIPDDTAKYVVMVRFQSSEPMTEQAGHAAKVFVENGGLSARYGTIMTGGNIGHRLLGVIYPSMAAIEAAYDAVQADTIYQETLLKINLGARNIVRLLG